MSSATAKRPQAVGRGRNATLAKAMRWREWLGLVTFAAARGVTFDQAKAIHLESARRNTAETARVNELGEEALANLAGCNAEIVEEWIERSSEIDDDCEHCPPAALARLLNALPAPPDLSAQSPPLS